MGRKQAEPSRDVRTVLDWTSRPALVGYIAEREAGDLLPRGVTFNSRPEILQRMAARCALEELGDRLECQRDHTRQQQNYIELLERKTRWLEAKVCNTEEVVGVGDVEMVLDPDAVIRSVREALAGGGMPDPMVNTPEDAVEDAKEALRHEEYLANKRGRQKALAEACSADYFRASAEEGGDARPWWSQEIDSRASSSGAKVGDSCESGEQHGKRKREGA